MTAAMFEAAFAKYDANPPRRAKHRKPRTRLTERGGYVVTVLLTVAVFALVCVAATILGGTR